MEAAVWAAGGGRCAGGAPAAAGEGPGETSLGRARLGGGGEESPPRNKGVSPRARRPGAHPIGARGRRARRAKWLCTTARSGMGYAAKGPKRDARRAKALRGWRSAVPSGATG